jgi:hypothetical protein
MDMFTISAIATGLFLLSRNKNPVVGDQVASHLPTSKGPFNYGVPVINLIDQSEQYAYAAQLVDIYKKEGTEKIGQIQSGVYLGILTGTTGDFSRIRTNLDDRDYFFFAETSRIRISNKPAASNKSYAEKQMIKRAFS